MGFDKQAVTTKHQAHAGDTGSAKVQVALLTIYDMCKSADKAMSIEGLTLWEKTGGKSGPYKRADGQ